MKTTKKYPIWYLLYFLMSKAYFFIGIPFFLFCATISTIMLLDDSYPKDSQAIYDTIGYWFLLLAPGIFMYLRAKRRKGKVRDIVQKIKGSGFYSPDQDYEVLSLTQGAYFGIDIKKGTMLYVQIYPGNVMDIIGLDVHNFTRTVSDNKTLDINTKYINMPTISVPIWCTSKKVSADTMHAMAERGGYHYPIDFPRMIQDKRKEWEMIAGMPVTEVF